MVRQGWLSPVRLPQGRGYTLTTKVARRLDEAGRRIYRDAPDAWDGRWHLLVIQHIPDRARRDRLRAGLGYLSHAVLDDVDQPSRLGRAGHPVRGRGRARGAVRPRGDARGLIVAGGDSRGLVARTWDLDGPARAYERWIGEAEELPATRVGDGDEETFAVRGRVVHKCRKFLFRDPGLPATLLPDDQPGARAGRFFDEEAARLLPAASRFVDRCLDGR